MADNVNIKINGIELSVPADYTVLEAARENGIDIPTLCYLKDQQNRFLQNVYC